MAQLAGTDIPVVRSDWFVATATRPPLYHTLLDLPRTATELETTLRVDVHQNFLRDSLARAGFRGSGVSGQSRLVERHDAAHGAYWKSYDFKPGNPKGDLAQLPLGPVFKENPFENVAFVHDGGEIIFNLPNGLQAYLLVNGKGRRIDEGPTKIVSVKNRPDPTVINGISCMTCHARGMIDKADQVRAHAEKNAAACVRSSSASKRSARAATGSVSPTLAPVASTALRKRSASSLSSARKSASGG